MKKIYLMLAGLLTLHLVFLFILRFTAWPEMLSYPYLVNKGFILYKDFVHPYPPLLTLVLAFLYKLFGYMPSVLKIFTWVLILINDYLIFNIVRKLAAKDKFALIATALYVLTQPFLEGNQLWFDLAIVTPILLGINFLFVAKTVKKIILSGLFFGVAALIKQTSGLFLIAGLIYLTVTTKDIKKSLAFLLGPLLLGVGLGIYLISNGSLIEFIKWNLIYPFTFWSKFPGYIEMNLTNGQMFILGVLLFPLFVMLAKNYKAVLKDKLVPVLVAFLALSFVMIYPRFSFFHFQLALSLIVITFGYLLYRFKFAPVLFAMFGMLTFFAIILPSLKRDIGLETRFWSSDDTTFSQKILDQTGGGSVYLLGLPSSLYVFSGTVPPKPWLDNYGWYFEIPGVTENTLAGWSANKPSFVITKNPDVGNWYDLGVYQPKQVVNWIDKGYEKKELLAKDVWLWQMK